LKIRAFDFLSGQRPLPQFIHHRGISRHDFKRNGHLQQDNSAALRFDTPDAGFRPQQEYLNGSTGNVEKTNP
jgi:hypothetical protein